MRTLPLSGEHQDENMLDAPFITGNHVYGSVTVVRLCKLMSHGWQPVGTSPTSLI
jgi:hypothetical protein